MRKFQSNQPTKKKFSWPIRALIIFIWLAIWEVASLLVHNDILLVGPIQTCIVLMRLVTTLEFWHSMGASLLRITIGTAIGCVTGILLAALSWRWNSIRAFLSPFVSVLKSIPVASFVILILIWFGNRNVSLIISLLVAFPILYVNTLSGLDALDQGMLEMAYVFKIPLSWKIRRIILPECYPAMSGGFSLAIGMGMKSGVAAEVIGQARYSLGNELYRSKIYLETADLLAWTIVIVLLSWIIERIWRYAFQRIIF